jgi:isopenicillin-N N-acyltransferase-like protein
MLRSCRTFLALWLFALFLPVPARAEPFRFPAGKVGSRAELKYVSGLPVLVVSGTPEEIGDAVGMLALKPAPDVIDYPRGLLKEFKVDGLYGIFVRSGTTMYNRFPPEYKAELDAMAQSSGVAKEKLIVGNTLFDIKKILACSAVLIDPGRSATGGALLGRNLDYPSLGYVQDYSLVTVYRPKGKHAFASVAFPGLVGCLSGMNDAGLSLAILEVMEIKEGEPRFDIEGVPYALCYRKLLEECTTIEEAKKLLTGMKRTATTNLVLADRTRVAVFEVSPKKVVERNPERGVCSCTNHYCSEEVRPAEVMNVARTLQRFRILEAARDLPGRITVADVHRSLDEANLGSLTLQTMVFEPATLKLHLAVGEIPASRGALKTIELGPLFKGQ